MTRAEFVLMARGFKMREAKELERSRLVAYQVYVGIFEGKGKVKKPITQYLPIPLIDNQSRQRLDPEYVKSRRAYFLERLN